MRSMKPVGYAVTLSLGTLIITVIPALAQAWPQRTVRVLVPNPAGVALDTIARLFAEGLAMRWRNPVIIENLPGVDGIPAAREFATRKDDHTLLYSFPGLITINPLLHDKLPYDPNRDLVPIASTSDNFLGIAVSTSLKIGSLGEFAQFARTNAGKVTWAATPGLPYYAFAAFQQSTRSKMVQASYRDFNQALADLGESRIDAVSTGVTPLLPHIQAGRARLLVVLNRNRASVAPDVPTVTEAGYPNLTFSAVTGFFGWRDMPTVLREHIAADVRAIASDPAVQARLTKLGATVSSGTPAEFVSSIEEQSARVAEITRSLKTAQ